VTARTSTARVEPPSSGQSNEEELSMTAIDVAGTPLAPRAVRSFAGRWCHDRALPSEPSADIVHLAHEAVVAGLHAHSSSISIEVGWDDADHARVAVGYHGHDGGSWGGVRLPPTVRRLFDELADTWRLSASSGGVVLWFVVNTDGGVVP
jgi:hypothetical protein